MTKFTSKHGLLLIGVLLISVLFVVGACGSIDTGNLSAAGGKIEQNQAKDEVKATPVASKEHGTSSAASGEMLADISCARCHEMNPEIGTWQVSSHSKIPCTLCHQVNEKDYASLHESNDFSNPIKVYKPVSDATCNQCHSMDNRSVTPSGDLIVPHDRHAQMGISCVSCHSGVVHANIAQRGVTTKGELKNFEKWTPEVAEEVALLAYSRPSMWTCLNCHKSLKVTTDCAVCHKEITSLPSHEADNWGSTHGLTGRQQVQSCIDCHKTPGGETSVTPSTGDKIADFARATEFCYVCHTQLPSSHVDPWLPAHPSKALAKGRLNCYACHDTSQPMTKENVTGTYCNECHWFGKEPAKSAENQAASPADQKA